jgi:tetratricopeptide (TPR) repeat protein
MNGKIDRIRVIESAERHVKAGKLKEAVSEYEKLLAEDPQDFGTNNIIGDLWVRLGQNEKAVRSFQLVASEYEKRGLHSQALAVYKKIAKIKPDDPDLSIKLADLYCLQGYAAEARKEYFKIAGQFEAAGKGADALRIYERIVKLDKEDLDARAKLAALYKEQGFPDAAAEQFDEIAESMIEKGDLDKAEQRFLEARDLSPFHPRTILGLVEVYKKENRRKEAIQLVEEAVRKDADNPRFLNLLGGFYDEDGEADKAEEIFARIVEAHPMNVNARIKLGRLFIRKESLDRAFELYEPLVDNLIKKQKEEKAIGLLGLILAAQKTHLPSLEKLAAIYRSGKDPAKLEVVNRVILDEQRRLKQKDKALTTLSELVKIRPDDLELFKEYQLLRKELGLPEEEEAPTGVWAVSEGDREVIQKTLDQADLYIQQGLVRNARRILENLRMKYSDDPLIMQKISALDDVRSQMSEEEIRVRVEKAQALEYQAKEHDNRSGPARASEKNDRPGAEASKPGRRDAGKTPSPAFPRDLIDEEKISTADIFAETDIIPFITLEERDKKYFDLKERIEEELRMIETIRVLQTRGATTQFEKELSVIVSDFKKGLKEKVPSEDYEIHYQLGIAFLEQGLYGEAIEEFTIAGKDKARALECYSIISQCYRRRKDFPEAERWLNKAILMTKEGSESYFALVYDRALLSEDASETDKALSLYKEIQLWNPAYRGIADKVSSLEKPNV